MFSSIPHRTAAVNTPRPVCRDAADARDPHDRKKRGEAGL